MAVNPGPYTIDKFEEIISRPENEDRLLELINGEIVEKVPTEEHGGIAAVIAAAFIAYKKLYNVSGYVGVEVRHQMPPDKENSYLPDVAFRLTTEPRIDKGAVPTMPDIAVEIQSANNSEAKLREKAHYYLLNGSRMVWLVLQERVVIVLTPDEEYAFTEDDIIDGGDVLADFALPVREIYNP